MQQRIIGLLTLVLALAGLGKSALAGPLSNDPAAMPNWANTQPFDGPHVHATVDYAVYAPGHFSNSVALGAPGSPPPDPSLAQDYVYAYQIINLPASTTYITELSVGLYPNAVPLNSTNIGNFVGPPADVAALPPDFSQFNAVVGAPKSSAIWSYSGEIDPTQHSDILYFTSPFPPTKITSSLYGAENVSRLLPTPVPEPNTLVLGMMAALAMLLAGTFGATRSSVVF